MLELPIDQASKYNFGLKQVDGNKQSVNKYSQSHFLLLKDGSKYEAYIMTIVADSAYIGGNPAKLANNSYRKRDADFSGWVLYFTPKGSI